MFGNKKVWITNGTLSSIARKRVYTSLNVILGNKVSRIIDSGASDHITSCFNLFTYIFHVWE